MPQMQHLRDNVHAQCPKVKRVEADIDEQIWNYLFKGVAPGSRGTIQSIITYFFQELYDECQRRKIPGTWEPFSDDAPGSEASLLDVVNSLNFNHQPVKHERRRNRKI